MMMNNNNILAREHAKHIVHVFLLGSRGSGESTNTRLMRLWGSRVRFADGRVTLVRTHDGYEQEIVSEPFTSCYGTLPEVHIDLDLLIAYEDDLRN